MFEQTWVLITGASSGLGEEFAKQLAARRANLILTARSGDKLEALAQALRTEHAIEIEVIALDLGVPGGAEKLCAAVDRLGHPVTHLISNAGFGTNGPIARADGARQAEMVRLNCEALTVLAHHFVPRLIEQKSGGILHLASVAGFQAVPFMATYGATKAFVLSFSMALAEEVREHGVKVMALCPGPVPTGFQATAGSGIAPSQRRAVLTAEETVTIGLAAYERGRTLCVPGGYNRISTLASKLMPRGMVTRMVAKMMRAKGRA